jgi:hypothetical protein
MGRSQEEFPQLEALGLKACDIRGDGKYTRPPRTLHSSQPHIFRAMNTDPSSSSPTGNCLFNALSDQLYGDQDRHQEIRQAVIKYMRENPDDFKPFIPVGQGHRRNPKRKNAGAFSSQFSFEAATEEQTERAWEDHLERMAQGGTYGDNLEILAFTKAYNTDVQIFQYNEILYSRAHEDKIVRPIAYIAYHVRVQ